MAKDYKDTLIFPDTDLDMRANLPENEPVRLEWWEDIDIYHKVLEKNADGEPFILHDGPPYANGPIHIGHAFNKILKDFVNKTHAQQGYFTPYIPGWDCHGQPIEHEVEKKLGTEKMNQMSQAEIRELCRQWAEKFVDVQREGFKRLGVNADWDRPYLTYTPSYESANVEVFKQMYLDGAVYRGRKPIHWCKHCHTALAEAEIEYGDETSPSIYVKFKMDSVPQAFADAGVTADCAYVLIWTTTPWTLPANAAVTLGPDYDYCFVKVGDDFLLFAKEMLETVSEDLGWEAFEVVSKDSDPVLMKGSELEGLTYQTPIMNEVQGRFICGDFVTMDAGTGVVHTAPGHGVDDYLAGQKYGIETIMPVDDDGRFMDYVPHFAGMDTDEANPHIIEWLREQGTLVGHQDIDHSYPHCWRCHEPVIFRATDQWFVSMDKTGLRERALDEIHNHVNFIPEWGVNRIGAMVSERPDWCISRQRNWGVPIPVFKCKSCGETVASEATFDAVIDLFNSEGADAWFTRNPGEYLPADTCCPSCGGTELIPDENILDVWWESGVSHVGVLKHRSEEDRLGWPAQMYLEGSDQHRGWFQSSLLCGVGAYGKAPYENVFCCGFTVDENGEKMSKSKGNGIDPADVIAKYGADVLRLWVFSSDYSVDVSIGDTILKGTSDAYRKFRNTFRFILGALADFDDEVHSVGTFEELLPEDQWAMARLAQILDEVNTHYDSYQYHKVFHTLYDYIGEVSNVILDPRKDRLYAESRNSHARRSAQTVLMNILEVLVRVLVPALSFTTEEVWQHYPEAIRNRAERPISVQLAGWPKREDFVPALPDNTEKLLADYRGALEIRDIAKKAMEDAGFNKSQEAELVISLPEDLLQIAQAYDKRVFEELCIVAKVSFAQSDEAQCLTKHTEHEKCPRCWNYRELGSNTAHPHVCERCGDVLDELGYQEA
ncbi:MAG: isoleucine--tRNA ligase [Eggerthellaceae bacterium]|nr:isoleucine--tRNA ligase [Eggerthellaceae bacterium]